MTDFQITETIKEFAPYITGGLGGSILTLFFRLLSERANQKIVQTSVNKQKFSLPQNFSQDVIDSDDLSVTYKGQGYSNLTLYTAKVENIGNGSVKNQEILITFPIGTEIIEESCYVSVPTITYKSEEILTDRTRTKRYVSDRIENGDIVILAFLIDCLDTGDISCLPRKVDGVEYKTGDIEPDVEIEQDIRQLLLYFSLYVFSGGFNIFLSIIPAIKALIIVASIPVVIRIANSIFLQGAGFNRNRMPSIHLYTEGNNNSIIVSGDTSNGGTSDIYVSTKGVEAPILEEIREYIQQS
jgi:hypothetical protein